MPPSGHPGVVTGLGCPLCDGTCRHHWQLPEVHGTYPFLPEEMVAAMQQPEDEQDTTVEQPVRGRRRGQNRARQLQETTARQPGEDRS